MNDKKFFQEVFEDLLIQYYLGLFDFEDFAMQKLSVPFIYCVRCVHYINFSAL